MRFIIAKIVGYFQYCKYKHFFRKIQLFCEAKTIYVNKELKITDREWICPECGARHDRDLLAANNILRRGIDELGDKINPQPSRAAVFVKS